MRMTWDGFIHYFFFFLLIFCKNSLHTLIMLKENKIHSISPRWGDQVRHRCDPLSTISFPESLLRRVHGWFITLVGAQTQTDWKWVEQSLSFSCLGKPCHHFKCVGGQQLLLYLAFSRFRHLSNFPITSPLHSSKGTWRSAVVTGRGSDCRGFKGHQLPAKNMFYANSHEVTPVDTVQEVMEQMDVWIIMIIFTFMFATSHPQDWISAAERHLLRLSLSWCLQRGPC